MPSALAFSHFIKIAEHHPSSEGHRLVLGKREGVYAEPLHKTFTGRIKPPSPAEKLENQKIWNAFKACIEQAQLSNPTRLETIFSNCKRYELDFDKNAKEGAPLYPVDVEKVGVAAGILKISDIGSEQEPLASLSPSDLRKRVKESDPFHFHGKTPDSQWHHGGPFSVKEYLNRDPFLAEQRQLRLFSLAGLLYPHPHAFPEHLAKGILSLEPTIGTVIPAPDSDKQMDYYQVENRIETKEMGGLFALLLKPISNGSKLPTVLGFRPTQIKLGYSGPLASINEDAQKAIGKKGYGAASPELRAAILAAGGNLVGVGYSKGGTELARCFIDNWQHFSEVIFFNDPSMEKELVEDFARMINALPRQDRIRTITVYRTENDVAHFGGEKHIGWGIRHPDFRVKVVEITHPSFKEQPRLYQFPKLLERHGQRHFLENDIAENSVLKIWEGRAADAQLDNTRRGKEIQSYEAYRLKWGQWLFKFTNFFYKLFVKLLTCFGFKVDRKSLEYV